MKAALVIILLLSGSPGIRAEDILFTNTIASFTNLQGQAYHDVQLVRGDQDGLIWRQSASGGRICYTNLDPALLESFGISSNRIDIAKDRAEHKAIADARYHALALAEAEAKLRAQAQLNLAKASARAPTGPVDNASAQSVATMPYGPDNADGNMPAYGYGPQSLYGPGTYYPGYNYGYPYGPVWWYGPGMAPSAPSAPRAPRAPSAPSALPAPSFQSAPPVRPPSVAPNTNRKPP